MATSRKPTSVKNTRGKFKDSGREEGEADFYNAKASKYSEGSSLKTGQSSGEPSVYSKEPFSGKYRPSVSNAESENSRASRMGKSETMSGPKSRTRNKEMKFLKHTTKGKK